MPPEFALLMIAFQPLFSKTVFEHALVLLTGALLAPGARTVTNALRMMGLELDPHYQNYHRVLNRTQWSARQASQRLLAMLIVRFVPAGPLVFGLDDTIERRRGQKIEAKGIYRDPVRSSKGHFVKASGLRWLSMMLLCEVLWASTIWALPFLTVLCPSERYNQEQGRCHKKLTDWARQVILQTSRWLPDRALIIVCDSSFAAIELLASVSNRATVITRLRLDAALYEPAPPRRPGQMGRSRKKGQKLPKLERRLNNKATKWTRLIISPWYGRTNYEVEVATGKALWYHSGMPPDSLGVGARPQRKARGERVSLDRPGLERLGDPVFFRASLARRGDLRGGASSPWGRDATSVVGLGDLAQHTLSYGLVFACDADGRCAGSSA